MPIYMKIDGIVGTVTVKPYVGWIELESAQLGSVRQFLSTGTATNRDGPGSNSDIVVTKNVDKASTALFELSLWGESENVTIVFVKLNEKNEWEKYLSIEIDNALVSNFSTSGRGGESKPSEMISFSFTKITYSTTAYDPKSRMVQPNRPGWTLSTK